MFKRATNEGRIDHVRIRKKRLGLGLNVSDLAAKTDINYNTLSMYLRNKKCRNPDSAFKISRVLGLSLEEFWMFDKLMDCNRLEKI